MISQRVKHIAMGGVIAALYVVLAVVFLPISFGVYQVRFAEALTVLPFLTPAAIPGLYIGCLLANIMGGMGWLDIAVGPLFTLLAAFATRWVRNRFGNTLTGVSLAPLPAVLFNAFGVSFYLAPIMGVNYWFAVQMIGVGQLIACYVLGVPLLLLLRNRSIFV
ncbi:MAG: QueT transporter family protein [Candidatus Zixiibacteriota bacterium]